MIPALPGPDEKTNAEELRAAMRRETDMNPLYPKHYATRSLMALVYDPLFEVGPDGRLIPVLAESIEFDASSMVCKIVIDGRKTFHSGRKLTSSDVKASLLTTIRLMTGSVPATDPENGQENPGNQTDHELESGESTDTKKSRRTDNLTALYGDASRFDPSSFSGMTHAGRNEYKNIISVRTEGDDTILLDLRNPDPDIAGLLTFPIIPESDVNQRTFNPISGTGSWRILDTGSGKHMILERVERGTGVNRIKATAFDNISLAMKAFDSDELDILVLNTTETSLYADRTRIRKQRIDYPGFISLIFRGDTREDTLLARDYMIREMRSDGKSDHFASPFSRAMFPIMTGDFRKTNTTVPEYAIQELPALALPENSPEPSGTNDDSGSPSVTEPDTRAPFVLLVPEGFTPNRLIGHIGACAARLGRRLTIVTAPSGEWADRLSRERFDAALLCDTSSLFLDPADYLNGLSYYQLLDWTAYADTEDVATLREARHFIASGDREPSPFSERTYVEAVSRVFSRLPVIGLAIPETMVAYGRNVQGTLSGCWHSPYKNVEDLSLWMP